MWSVCNRPLYSKARLQTELIGLTFSQKLKANSLFFLFNEFFFQLLQTLAFGFRHEKHYK